MDYLRITATVVVLIVAGVFVVYWPIIRAKVGDLFARPGRLVDQRVEQALRKPMYYRYWLTRNYGEATEVTEAEYAVARVVAASHGTLDDDGALSYTAHDGVKVIGFRLLSQTPPQVSAVMPGADPESFDAHADAALWNARRDG